MHEKRQAQCIERCRYRSTSCTNKNSKLCKYAMQSRRLSPPCHQSQSTFMYLTKHISKSCAICEHPVVLPTQSTSHQNQNAVCKTKLQARERNPTRCKRAAIPISVYIEVLWVSLIRSKQDHKEAIFGVYLLSRWYLRHQTRANMKESTYSLKPSTVEG